VSWADRSSPTEEPEPGFVARRFGCAISGAFVAWLTEVALACPSVALGRETQVVHLVAAKAPVRT
jgi:hypothetical protein